MTEEKQQRSGESLGEYLQRQRKEKNFSREEITQETRIPPRTLEAMENDDYDSLPAETFARGFYTLYAKCLELEPEYVLARFDQERTTPAAEQPFIPPSKLEKQINPMASGPSFASGPVLVIGLLLIVAVTAYLFYYSSLNPVGYVNDQLDQIQQDSPTVSETNSPSTVESSLETKLEKQLPETRYFLTIDFLKDTTITIAIDDALPVEESYEQGATQSWYADEEISLLLPADTEVDLFFDGYRLDLPPPHNGTIRLNLP
ncbi:MAG: helix-turn-helix domain-containing protein [Desulfocapsaceae bacterium]|nr:helix-turn-helix domain-containing protein [Desulfocapsaceae bacterium]